MTVRQSSRSSRALQMATPRENPSCQTPRMIAQVKSLSSRNPRMAARSKSLSPRSPLPVLGSGVRDLLFLLPGAHS